MVKPLVQKETPVSLVELKAKLEEIKIRDGELNFRGTKTEDYLNQIGLSLTIEKGEELIKKLEEMEIPRLKREHIVKILDIMPVTEEQLKLVLQGYILTVSQANMKKITDLVKEYLPEEK